MRRHSFMACNKSELLDIDSPSIPSTKDYGNLPRCPLALIFFCHKFPKQNSSYAAVKDFDFISSKLVSHRARVGSRHRCGGFPSIRVGNHQKETHGTEEAKRTP